MPLAMKLNVAAVRHKRPFPSRAGDGVGSCHARYLDINHFDDVYKGPGDSFFGRWRLLVPKSIPFTGRKHRCSAAERKHGCCAIFSKPTVDVESNGKQWFNPDISVIYPDRIAAALQVLHLKAWARIPILVPGTVVITRLSARFCQCV